MDFKYNLKKIALNEQTKFHQYEYKTYQRLLSSSKNPEHQTVRLDLTF